MNWSDIAGIVGKSAPLLGAALGGPAGAALGGLVAAALGTDNTPDAVNAAVLADPVNALKLIELQNADGSWVNDTARWMEKDPALVTSYCVLALETVFHRL